MKDKDKHKHKEGKSKRAVVDNILIVVFLCMAVFAAVQLIRIFWGYHVAEKSYDALAERYVESLDADDTTMDAGVLAESETDSVTEEEESWKLQVSVDITALKEVNPDIVGWILFENEDISLPILHTNDNATYLRKTYDKTPNSAGSIFMDKDNQGDFTDLHTILYGHNMKNLSMFGKLKYYVRDPEYYEGHKYFDIFTENMIYRYEIFSYETVPADSNHYRVTFVGEEDYANFISQVNASAKDAALVAAKDEPVLTLATCSTGGEDNRFLVHAIKIDEQIVQK